MQPQFDNRVISSFLLMLDHEIQKRGQAYANQSSLFYPVRNPVSNSYAYAAPFKQLSNDTSVTGATIMSGIYLNNHFVIVGQSGLQAINHYKGTVYFNSALPTNTVISGSYATKEFNVELVDQPEWKLLFETQYISSNMFNQALSGLPLDTKTTPSIFIRTKVQGNKPFSLGGMDDKTLHIRAIVVVDNEFQRLGVCDILKNLNYRPLPIVNSTPFDSLGNMTGVNYNYEQLSFDSSVQPWILGVKVIDIPQEKNFQNINRNMAMVDFDISAILRHTY